MLELRLYLAQRISAAIMVPLVLLHLGVMIYAVRGGLDAAEILERTRGSLLWGANYGLFVLAAAIHAGIGLRNVLCEWGGLRGLPLALAGWFVFALLLAMGWRAVYILVVGA